MSPPNTVSVKILDKEYQVACPADQEAELLTSARYLDQQMRSIRESGKVIGLERIAVMAALNISHELIHATRAQAGEGEAGPVATGAIEGSTDEPGLSSLHHKLDEALYSLRQLEIG